MKETTRFQVLSQFPIIRVPRDILARRVIRDRGETKARQALLEKMELTDIPVKRETKAHEVPQDPKEQK